MSLRLVAQGSLVGALGAVAGCETEADLAQCEPKAAPAICDSPDSVTYPLAARHEIPRDWPFHALNTGGGTAIEDLDGDGWLDVVVTSASGDANILWNDGGSFGCSETLPASQGSLGVSVADVDNDGDPDLHLARRGFDQLWVNEGGRNFERDHEAMLPLDHLATGAAQWGDVDGDGWLDLLVLRVPEVEPFSVAESARLHHGLWRGGPGRRFRAFADPELDDLQRLGSSLAAALVDLDGDGDLDLHFTQEFGSVFEPSRTLINHAPIPGQSHRWFERIVIGSRQPDSPMGIAILHDGTVRGASGQALPALYLSNLVTSEPGHELLLQARADGSLFEHPASSSAAAMDLAVSRTSSWAAVAADFDNDGDEDILVGYGPLRPTFDFSVTSADYPPARSDQPDALLRREGPVFVGHGDVHSCRADTGNARGIAFGDLDRDGCLDTVTVDHGSFARVTFGRCRPELGWIGLRLVASAPRDATGSYVEVTAGARQHVRRVLGCSQSAHSCSSREIHIGLGEHGFEAVSARIDWPSGCRQTLPGLIPGSVHTIVEPVPCPPEGMSPASRG